MFPYLLYLCLCFFPFSPKKLFCVLSLKVLVVVGTGRVVGEGGGGGGGMGGLFNTFSFYLSSALPCSARLIKLISSSFILASVCKI